MSESGDLFRYKVILIRGPKHCPVTIGTNGNVAIPSVDDASSVRGLSILQVLGSQLL